jgi:hypothetical protein
MRRLRQRGQPDDGHNRGFDGGHHMAEEAPEDGVRENLALLNDE